MLSVLCIAAWSEYCDFKSEKIDIKNGKRQASEKVSNGWSDCCSCAYYCLDGPT